ncbi:unnamed protein product [Candida verbasci]|uniref:Sm domain-containing protein n=1 Tax=Candida verbasci TaxID=1227364 RepID=A0A9W4X7U4_9ASCO|nr:unnamed protein product [Candida verbasci]
MTLNWSSDIFQTIYDRIKINTDIDTIDFSIIKDDLVNILISPLPSSGSNQLKETVKFSNGDEVKLNQPFIELATILSTELNLEELACAELIYYSNGISYNKGTSLVDSARLNYYSRFEYILNILGYLITENRLDLITSDYKVIFDNILKSFEKIYKLLDLLNDWIDKQKITSDINNLSFINYINYAKSQLFKGHELLGAILYNFTKNYKQVITLTEYKKVLELIEKNINGDEDILIIHFIPFGMEVIQFTNQKEFYNYIINKINIDKNKITDSTTDVDLSLLKISGYEILISFVFLTQFIAWCKEQNSTDIDFRSEILTYLELLISFGVLERLLCYCAETTSDQTTFIYDFRSLLQRNIPKLKPVKFVYPNSQDLVNLNLPNVSKLVDASSLKLNPELNENLIAPFFQKFFNNFTINCAYVLTSLRDSEEDFVLSSENDLDEISQRGDLERYYLAFAYTFYNRPKLCNLFWNDEDGEVEGDILGFILWGLSNNTAPLITATFCLLLSCLTMNKSTQIYEILMNNNHHGLTIRGKSDYSKISIDSLFDSLNYYIDSIVENFENDLNSQIKNQQLQQKRNFNYYEENENNGNINEKIVIELAEDSIIFICGFFNLISSILKYSNFDIKFKIFNRFSPIIKNFLKFDNLIQGSGQVDLNKGISGSSSKFVDIPNIIISNESRNVLVNLILNYLNDVVYNSTTQDDLILRYEVWKLLDCWIYFGFKDVKYKIKTINKPFQKNLIEINQILNFTKLINSLLKINTIDVLHLQFPCDLGMDYRNFIGIWQYIEFIMIEVFANSNELKNEDEKIILQNDILEILQNNLSEIDWNFIEISPRLVRASNFKFDSLIPNVQLSFENFVKLHPSVSIMNYLFENKAFRSLFQIINNEQNEHSLISKSLNVVNLLLENQNVYINKLLPILKNKQQTTTTTTTTTTTQQQQSATASALITTTYNSLFNFIYIPKNVGTHGVSNFFEILLFNLPTVVHFALYINYPNYISEDSIKILNKLSQSKFFQRKIQYDKLLNKDRLLTTFENIDESQKVKFSFIDKFEEFEEENIMKYFILKFLINNLDSNIITVSHFLLGYQIRGDKLDLNINTNENLLLKNLLNYLVADEVDIKLSSLIMELIIKLAQDPISSFVTLHELRKFELFEKLLTKRTNVIFEFDGNLQMGYDNQFLSHESIELFFNFIQFGKLTLQYLSLEFHSSISKTKRKHYIDLLIHDEKAFLNKQPKILQFLDILNYQFQNFEIQKYEYLNNEYYVENILNNLQFEKNLKPNYDFKFKLLSEIHNDNLDEFIMKYLVVEDLNKLQLDYLHSWCQLIEIIIDEETTLPILEILQVIIPKINDYYQYNILFSEELISLSMLLFDYYKGELSKLSQLFQTCVSGVTNSNSTPNSRSYIFVLLNKFILRQYSFNFEIEDKDSDILDQLIKNNSLLLLSRSLKRTNEIMNNNGISLNYLIFELTAFKIIIYLFIKISKIKVGCLNLIQNDEIFKIITDCIFLKIDPDIGIEINLTDEKVRIGTKSKDANHYITIYEFLIPIFQLISTILISMGPKYRPSIVQTTEIMKDKKILITELVKKIMSEEEVSDSNTNPSNFLSGIIGSSVVVKLHNGIKYKGNLSTIDGYMNIVLDQCNEIINSKITREYKDVFIRGNNVLYISEA